MCCEKILVVWGNTDIARMDHFGWFSDLGQGAVSSQFKRSDSFTQFVPEYVWHCYSVASNVKPLSLLSLLLLNHVRRYILKLKIYFQKL